MKARILILNSILFICASAFAQNKACDEVFKKYASKKGFTLINIPGLALKFFVHDKTDPDFKLTYFRMISAEDSAVNANINFYDEIMPKINRDDYKEMISVKEKNQNFILLCKQKNDKITEFILISGGKENLLVNFVGRISLSDMFKVSQTLSEADNLKEIE